VAGFYFRDPDAPAPNCPPKIGAAALVEHDGALLLDRRVDPVGWALPAGSVEAQESVTDALRRELAEETRLQVESATLFGVFSDPSRIVRYADGNTYRVITIAFLVDIVAACTLRASAESAELRFVPKDELAAYDLIATHRPIIELYLSGATPPFID
jgi:ADP-ribose pyrophosphatase YjhB (NUDIX family)